MRGRAAEDDVPVPWWIPTAAPADAAPSQTTITRLRQRYGDADDVDRNTDEDKFILPSRFSLGVRGPSEPRRGSMWRLWGSKKPLSMNEIDFGQKVRQFESFASPRRSHQHDDTLPSPAATAAAPAASNGLSSDTERKLKGWLARIRWARALIASDPRRVIHALRPW